MTKILLAEDDKFFSAIYKNKLSRAGFEVEVVEDGEAAIEYLKTKTPDILILDLVMPKKDGFEVITFLKNDDKLKDVPLIVFSSLNQKADIEKAKGLGVDDYFDKSTTDFETLKSKINKLLKI